MIDPQTGLTAREWIKFFQGLAQAVNAALTILGQFDGQLGPNTTVATRAGNLVGALQNLTVSGTLAASALTGIVQPAQLPAAIPTNQGAVVLPAGAASNTLGTAALSDSSSFDAAGAAAAAQAAAEAYAAAFATTAANNAQTNAETFAADSSNQTSGTLAAARLPANVPVISYGVGAPVAASTEGYLYFDTTGTPYHGYVYHSGAWVQFS